MASGCERWGVFTLNPSAWTASRSSACSRLLQAASGLAGQSLYLSALRAQVRVCVQPRCPPVLCEKAQVQGQVEIRHGLVDEASVAGLIT